MHFISIFIIDFVMLIHTCGVDFKQLQLYCITNLKWNLLNNLIGIQICTIQIYTCLCVYSYTSNYFILLNRYIILQLHLRAFLLAFIRYSLATTLILVLLNDIMYCLLFYIIYYILLINIRFLYMI